MIITVEHEINLDRMMEYIGDEIERIIRQDECIDWDSITETSRTDLYKKIVEYILKEWA